MKNKWIHFSIDRESLIGMLSGVGIVILSVIMTIFNNDIANIILRDILMILVLGFFFPLYFTIIENKKSVSVLGNKYYCSHNVIGYVYIWKYRNHNVF